MPIQTTDSHRTLTDPELLRTAAYVGGSWVEEGDAGRFTVANP